MRSRHTTLGLAGGLAAVLVAGSALTQPTVESTPVPSDIGPHHRMVRWIEKLTDEDGARLDRPRRYVELATGLNRFDPVRKGWVAAKARFELARSGHVILRQAQHRVILAPDLRQEGAVDLLTPDGKRLRSTILGVGVRDTRTGESCLLAELQPCQAELISPTEVLYRDAFDDIHADVRYSIDRHRFEQDLILRDRIAPEHLQAVGIDPDAAELFVMTEFFTPPTPQPRERTVRTRTGKERPDQELDFGAMTIGAGRAFRSGPGPGSIEAPVMKAWNTLEGRHFLIETADYEDLTPLLETLPAPGEARLDRMRQRFDRWASVPSPLGPAAPASPVEPGPAPGTVAADPDTPAALDTGLLLAAADSRPGVVLDYPMEISSTFATYTFQADTTYYLSGPVTVSGRVVLEGGAVLKYAPGARLICGGAIDCLTGPYQPVVFTARDDNTCGETVGGSSGNPSANFYASPALQINRSGQDLRHLRISHAQTAILLLDYSAGGTGNTLRHLQFVRCHTAVQAHGYGTTFQNLRLYNALGLALDSLVRGYSFNAELQHLTVIGCNRLVHDDNGLSYGTTSSALLVNSLLTGVAANTGDRPVTLTRIMSPSAAINAFLRVGAGTAYLPSDSSHRNAGTTNINPVLAEDLRTLTTQPPALLGPTLIATNLCLGPRAARDMDLPDLGYHYAPIDHLFSLVTVTNGATLSLLPGTALAMFGYRGLVAEDYSRVTAVGTPDQLIHLTHYSSVQEQSTNWGNPYNYAPTILTGPPHATIAGSLSPSITLRFVVFSLPGAFGRGIHSANHWYALKSLTIRDCQFMGGENSFSGSQLRPAVIELQNNLLFRNRNLFHSWPSIQAHNNLFLGGHAEFQSYQTGSWWVRDNVFHGTSLTNRSLAGTLIHSHNAYVGAVPAHLGGTNLGNVVLADFPYTEGPFGRFYHATTNLCDRGSRLATSAGLAQHTTRPDQTKEEATPVDIGFHYVAAESYHAATAFHGTQGSGGWWYQFAPLQGLPSGYLTNFTVSRWFNWSDWRNQYCYIQSYNQHPGLDYDSVRTFVAPRSGRARVLGEARDQYSLAGGDGVRARLLHNGASLIPWTIIAEGRSAPMNATTLLNAGDRLHFQVNAAGLNSYDSTLWTPAVIFHAPADTDQDGLPDFFEDSNGDGLVNSLDGSGDADGDGVIDRLDARPFDPRLTHFRMLIESPPHGSTLN